jgi:hypothetical protein
MGRPTISMRTVTVQGINTLEWRRNMQEAME